jgi:chromosome segregation ATPase
MIVLPEVINEDLTQLINTYNKYVINASNVVSSYTKTDIDMIRDVYKFTKIQAYNALANEIEYLSNYQKSCVSSPAYAYYLGHFKIHWTSMKNQYLKKLEENMVETLYILATNYFKHQQYKRMIWCYVTLILNGDIGAGKILGDFYKSNGLKTEAERYYAISLGLDSVISPVSSLGEKSTIYEDLMKEINKINDKLENINGKLDDIDYDVSTKLNESFTKLIENKTQLILNDIAEFDDILEENMNELIIPSLTQIITTQKSILEQRTDDVTTKQEGQIDNATTKLDEFLSKQEKQIDNTTTKLDEILSSQDECEKQIDNTTTKLDEILSSQEEYVNDLDDLLQERFDNISDSIVEFEYVMNDKFMDASTKLTELIEKTDKQVNVSVEIASIKATTHDVMIELNDTKVALHNLAKMYEKHDSENSDIIAAQDKQIYKQQKQIDDSMLMISTYNKATDVATKRENELMKEIVTIINTVEDCVSIQQDYKIQLANMADRNKAAEILISQQQRQLESNSIMVDNLIKQDHYFLTSVATKINELSSVNIASQQQTSVYAKMLTESTSANKLLVTAVNNKQSQIENYINICEKQQKQINELIEINIASQKQIDHLAKMNDSIKEFTIV